MYDYKEDDALIFGEQLHRTYRRKGSNRWDMSIYKKSDNEYFIVYRHSRGQKDKDGVKRNHKRTETVYRAESLSDLYNIQLPEGPDKDILLASEFWKSLADVEC